MSAAIEDAEEDGNTLALLVIINCHVSDLDTCEEALSALFRIVSSTSHLDLGESSKSMVDTLVLSLDKHVSEPSLVEVAFSCMRVCASKSHTLQTLLCSEDTAELIIRAMCTHASGEETVQEQGCLLVSALATNCPANIGILRAMHIERVLDQAAGLITNERNKRYPDEARQALGLVKR